jgi:hypothetical protein
MKNKKIFEAAFIVLTLSLIFVGNAHASMQCTNSSIWNIWAGASCASCSGGPTGPCGLCDALIVASNIARLLFGAAVTIATLMIVVGAVQLMIAGGSEEGVSKGRNTLKMAVTGFVIGLCAWIIVHTIFQLFSSISPAGMQSIFSAPWNQISC